jgi:hypothetical protein
VSDEFGHGQRIAAVETEVHGLKTDIAGVKSDVKGLSAILSRIEVGISQARSEQTEREALHRVNPVAVVTVIITLMSMMVGGSWMISGKIERMDERSVWVQKQVDRNEQRIWRYRHGGQDGDAVEAK